MQKSIVKTLRSMNFQIDDENELNNGIVISELINQVFYNGNNDKFINRIIKDNPERKGNNVLNMNIIMKQLKNDNNIQKPLHIQSLTSFTLVEDKEKLNEFVLWILSNKKQQEQQYNEDSYQQQQRNEQVNNAEEQQLANLYFASELSDTKAKFIDHQINDSLDDQPSNRVAKKGSFKLLRPKSDFPTQKQEPKDQSCQQQPVTLRQISNSLNKAQKMDNDIQQRKTIPKISHKPPIYRQLNKQNTKSREVIKQQKHYQEQQPTPQPFQYHSSENSIKKEQIYKDIAKIQQEITQHKISQKNISFTSQEKKRNRSRSIFKIEVKEVHDYERKQIVQWLIHINLLNSLAVTYYANLHQICKNGVIFPEIINYLKGRGAELSYFKDPKRSAEMNSNYQKVFAFFKQNKQFHSQLMFMYEYFIPQAQQKAFWSFLKSIFISYSKIRGKRNQTSFDYDASIRSKLNKVPKAQSSKKPSIESPEEQYKKIKYASAKKNSKNSSRKNSEKKIQFVHQQLPETQPIKQKLVQNQEPIEMDKDYLMIADSHGYKDIHQKKQFKKYDTPKKGTNMNNFSMSRSRIIMNSNRKNQQKPPAMPQVNLDMEMKAMRYLTDNELPNLLGKADLELFKDPFRNGTLINEIVQLQTKKSHRFITKPKSIEDCRNNFQIAYDNVRLFFDNFPSAYGYYLQNMIKGEKALFYGFVYHVSLLNKPEKQMNLQKSRSNSVVHKNSISNPSPYSFSTYFKNQNTSQSHMIKIADAGLENQCYNESIENIMSWIRTLQNVSENIASLKIRDMESLLKAIYQENFLYHFIEILQNKNFITPNFHKAVSDTQVQSNLKKVINFMVQKKWVASDLLLKIRKIARKDTNSINYLLKELMHLTKVHIVKGSEDKIITFVKYLKPQKQNLGERLETTMANHSTFVPKQQVNVHHQKNQSNLDIKWMRKLGFHGDLRINNGVILCQLLSRLTMKTIEGVNNNPASRGEALFNIRKAIKVIGAQFKWDENEILDADDSTSNEIYKFLKEKYKHAYALKFAQ